MSRRFYRADLIVSRRSREREARDGQRLQKLAEENRKLRQLVSIQTLVIESMRETIASRADLKMVRSMAELIKRGGLGRLRIRRTPGVGLPSPRCEAPAEGSVSQVTRLVVKPT